MSPLVLVIILSVLALIMEISAIALKMTGLPMEQARFQALSALTGTGFTTHEAELIVVDPSRRRIVMVLMLIGNVGLASIIVTLFGTFRGSVSIWAVLVALAGLGLLYLVAHNRWLVARLHHQIQRGLERGKIVVGTPIEEVLALGEDYAVAEVRLHQAASLVGKTLAQADLRHQGVMVLAIWRGKEIIHTPRGGDVLEAEDLLVVYGLRERICSIIEKQENLESDGGRKNPQENSP